MNAIFAHEEERFTAEAAEGRRERRVGKRWVDSVIRKASFYWWWAKVFAIARVAVMVSIVMKMDAS